MMSLIVVDGDGLIFEPLFGPRTVTIIGPATITGSGQATIVNKKVCIAGDEKKVSLSATYTMPGFANPGTGTVTISQLDSSQEAKGSTSGAALITKGLQFDARFTPQTPAANPPPTSTSDASGPSQGKGIFSPTQQNFAMAGTA